MTGQGMDTFKRIDRLVTRLGKAQQLTERTQLYAEATKVKLRQACYAVEMLKQLAPQEDNGSVVDSGTGTPRHQLTITEQIYYHCDAFWDFLRASLDVLAQLVNERLSLGIPEREVDVKAVTAQVRQGSAIRTALSELLRSEAFTALEEYRNCSIHRRHIFIEVETVTRSSTGSRGYSTVSTEPHTDVNRYLSINPWDLRPRTDKKRPVAEYCEKLLAKLQGRIDKVVNQLG